MTRFDRLLQNGLRSAGSPEAHLDADQLSAFAESGTGRAMVMDHAARCPECREALFLISGERVSAPPTRLWRWAWVPAIAALCALGVGIPVLLQRNAQPHLPVLARALPPPRPAREAPVVPPALSVRIKPILKNAVILENPRANGNDEHIPIVVQAEPPMAMPAPSPIESEQLKPPQAQMLPAVDQTRQASAGRVPAQQQDAVQQINQLSQERQPSPPGAFFNPQPPSLNQSYRLAARPARTPLPARALQWAINNNVPEQSADSGLSWRQAPIDANIRFLAIGNFASSVWAGGAAGALFHSYDNGNHWRRVSVMDGRDKLATDIVNLRVVSIEEIHLISASGERWETQDGGQTWKRE